MKKKTKQKTKKTNKKNIRNRTCPIASGKHMWNKFHIRFSMSTVYFLMCSKTYVENIPWKSDFRCISLEGSDIITANTSYHKNGCWTDNWPRRLVVKSYRYKLLFCS